MSGSKIDPETAELIFPWARVLLNSSRLLRSLFGVAPLCAAAFALCAAIGVRTDGAAAVGILYLVDSTGDGDLVGSSNICDDGTGHCTLRAAIEASNLHSGTDFISFNIPTSDPGYSNGMWTINLPRALPDLSDAVSISGPGADKLIVNVGEHPFRFFNITTSGTVNLSGLTLTNGALIDDNGGGIQNYNAATVNITNCNLFAIGAFSDNVAVATNGGGIYNRAGGTVNVTNCDFEATSAAGGNGGCIYNSSTGRINVTNSRLADSFASIDGTSGIVVSGVGNGGGIYNLGTMTVTNSTLYLLVAFNNNGGGIYNAGTMTVTNSVLYDITARTNGGAIYNGDFATINVINSTIYGNDAAAYPAGHNATLGGGIYNRGALNVSNSTISGNSTDTTGGGIYNDSQATGNATIKSTIIAKNTAGTSDPDVAGSFASQGFNLVGSRDGSTGFTAATDQTGTVASPLDPKLDANGVQNNGGPTQTVALLTGSPAIDKGTSNGLTGTLTIDQRGVGYARTVDKSVPNATGGDGTDIGAFEFGAQIKAVSSKQHGTVGTFSIKLPLFGPKLGVECRDGGTSGIYKVILTFPTAVTVNSASVTPDPKATGATASVSSFSVSGSKVTVDLTGVSNAQTIRITLSGVSDGTNTNDVSGPMGVLLGDTNRTRAVNSKDVTLTQSKVGQTVDGTNFREDVTVDGSIDSNDVNLVQSKVGTKLP